MPELLQRIGTVEACGLIEVRRDLVEARQEDEHVVARAAPDPHQGQGAQRRFAAVQRLAEDAEDLIEDQGNYHAGRDARQEVEGAEQPLQRLRLAAEQRQGQRGGEHADEHHDDIE